MNQLEEHHNIRIGDKVYPTLLFDGPDMPEEVNMTNFMAISSGRFQVLETRSGIIERIDDLDASLFGITFRVLYPNGKSHGSSISHLRPDGILLVLDD